MADGSYTETLRGDVKRLFRTLPTAVKWQTSKLVSLTLTLSLKGEGTSEIFSILPNRLDQLARYS